MQPIDRSRDLPAAVVLAVLIFLIFAALVAAILTGTTDPKDTAVAWVGTGLVGLGAVAFIAWAVVLQLGAELEWARRVGGDLLLLGVAVGLVAAGLPTYAAGVI
jgi:hypothetical protein